MYQAFLPWLGFGSLVFALLSMDLLVFHRRGHTPTLRESAGWCVFWIGLALTFNALVWWWKGPDARASSSAVISSRSRSRSTTSSSLR